MSWKYFIETQWVFKAKHSFSVCNVSSVMKCRLDCSNEVPYSNKSLVISSGYAFCSPTMDRFSLRQRQYVHSRYSRMFLPNFSSMKQRGNSKSFESKRMWKGIFSLTSSESMLAGGEAFLVILKATKVIECEEIITTAIGIVGEGYSFPFEFRRGRAKAKKKKKWNFAYQTSGFKVERRNPFESDRSLKPVKSVSTET